MKIKLGLVFMMLLLVLMGASYASDDNQTDGQLTIDGDASIEKISQENQDELSSGGDSFTDLQDEIDTKDDVILDKNYTFDESKDNTIVVTGEKTIDGAGHAVNANGKSGIFNVSSPKVTFKNITFLNGNGNDAGAIYFNNVGSAILENCKFINSFGQDGVIHFNGGNLTIRNCEFINVSPIFISSTADVTLNNLEFKNSQINNVLVYVDVEGNLTLDNISIDNITPKQDSDIVDYDYNLNRDIWTNSTGDYATGLTLISRGDVNLSNIHVNDVESLCNEYLHVDGVNINVDNVLIENSAISNMASSTFAFSAVNDFVMDDFTLKNVANSGINTTEYSYDHRKYYYSYDSRSRGGNGISVTAGRNASITNLNITDTAGGTSTGILTVDCENFTLNDVFIDNLYLPMETTISYDTNLDLELYDNETSMLYSGFSFTAREKMVMNNVKVNKLMSGYIEAFNIYSKNIILTDVEVSNSHVSSHYEYPFKLNADDSLIVDAFILNNISMLEYNHTDYESGKYVWEYESSYDYDFLGVSMAADNVSVTNMNMSDLKLEYAALLTINANSNLTFGNISIENVSSDFKAKIGYDSSLGQYIYRSSEFTSSCEISLIAAGFMDIFNVTINNVVSKGGESIFLDVNGGDVYLKNVSITNSNVSGGEGKAFEIKADKVIFDSVILDNVCTPVRNITGYDDYRNRYYWSYTNDPGEGDSIGMEIKANDVTFTNVNFTNMALGTYDNLLTISSDANLTFRDVLIENITSRYTVYEYKNDPNYGDYYYSLTFEGASAGVELKALGNVDISNIIMNQVWGKAKKSSFFIVGGFDVEAHDIVISNSNISNEDSISFSADNDLTVENFTIDNCTTAFATQGGIQYDESLDMYVVESEGMESGYRVNMVSGNDANISGVTLINLSKAGYYNSLLYVTALNALDLDNVLMENITPIDKVKVSYDTNLREYLYENSTGYSPTGLYINSVIADVSNVKINNLIEPDETHILGIYGGDLTLRNVSVSNTTYQVYSSYKYSPQYGKYVLYQYSDYESAISISGNNIDIDDLTLDSIPGVESIIQIYADDNLTINNSKIRNFVTNVSFVSYNSDMMDYVYTNWTWGNVLTVGGDNVLIDNTIFENITVGDSDSSYDWGHVLSVISPDSTISNCAFKDIKAIWNVTEFDRYSWTYESIYGETKGSAINFYYGGNIIDSSFSNCSSDYGGAIYALKPLNITGSEFINCSAKMGGAIYIDGVGLLINNTLFETNKATNGGALFFTNQSINNTVYNVTFLRNLAENNGGAVYIFESENEGLNLINASRFYYNHANYNGGAFFFNDTINDVVWDDYRWHNATASSKIHNDLTFISKPLERTMIVFCQFEQNSDYSLNITAHNNAVGGNHTVTVNVDRVATGYVYVNITDMNGNYIRDKQGREINGFYLLENGTVILELEDLPVGDYNASSYYAGWDYGQYYLYYHVNSTVFSIYPHDVNLTVNRTIYADENLTVIAELNNLTTGTVNITVSNGIDNITYTNIPVINGTVSYDISGLCGGDYNVTVTYNGDDIFYPKSNTTNFTVKLRQSMVDVSVKDNVYGNVTKIIVDVPKNQTGNVTVSINNHTYTKEVTNGTVVFDVPGLNAGEWEANVTFNENGVYAENNTIFKFNVTKANLTANVTGNNVTVKDNASLIIDVPDDYKGNVTIEIDGKTYYDGPVSGIVNITTLPAGNYTANVGFYGDNNYNDAKAGAEFNVSPVEPEMNVTITNATYGGNATAYISVSGNANGTVNITVDGKTYIGNVINGTATVQLDNLTAGVKEAEVKFITSDRYNSNTTARADFTVGKMNSTVMISNVNSTVVIRVSDNATGNVTVYVNGDKYIRPIVDNQIIIEDVLAAGDNSIVAIYAGDANYYGSDNSTKVTLPLKINVTDLLSDEERVIINVTGISSGNVTVMVDNGQKITKNLTSGNAVFDLTGLSHDIHNITIIYPDGTVEVIKLDGRVNASFEVTTIKSEDMVRGYNSPYDYQAAFLDSKGNALVNTTVTFRVNGKEYNVITDDEGVAQLNNSRLAVGKYKITSINTITGEEFTNELEIVKRILENKDLTMDFTDGSQFVVKVIGDDGKIAPEGEIIDITANGVHYACKVKKDGYAALTINLLPKKYTITAEYRGYKTTNKLVVKQILKPLKKVTTIKQGKKLVLKAQLKYSNGKAIKGKTIKFKLKGKTYKAKTNKKGIAMVTIKKKVTKKLKKGKKYKVTVSYDLKYKYGDGYETISDKVKCYVKVKK